MDDIEIDGFTLCAEKARRSRHPSKSVAREILKNDPVFEFYPSQSPVQSFLTNTCLSPTCALPPKVSLHNQENDDVTDYCDMMSPGVSVISDRRSSTGSLLDETDIEGIREEVLTSGSALLYHPFERLSIHEEMCKESRIYLKHMALKPNSEEAFFGAHLKTIKNKRGTQHFFACVQRGSAAYLSALRELDELLMINEHPVPGWEHNHALEWIAQLASKNDGKFSLVVRRMKRVKAGEITDWQYVEIVGRIDVDPLKPEDETFFKITVAEEEVSPGVTTSQLIFTVRNSLVRLRSESVIGRFMTIEKSRPLMKLGDLNEGGVFWRYTYLYLFPNSSHVGQNVHFLVALEDVKSKQFLSVNKVDNRWKLSVTDGFTVHPMTDDDNRLFFITRGGSTSLIQLRPAACEDLFVVFNERTEELSVQPEEYSFQMLEADRDISLLDRRRRSANDTVAHNLTVGVGETDSIGAVDGNISFEESSLSPVD